MITFLTLYLGLIVGPRQFELAVGEEVARVEIFLDGEQHTGIGAPPWEFTLDFGEVPLPHELLAVAYDGGGEEVGRAFQRLNVPHPPVEVVIALESEGGRVRAARLAWAAAADEALTKVRMRLDGERIPVEDPTHVPLPELDMSRTHHLSAEVTFRGRLRSQAAVVFGGEHVDRVDSELTAVVVERLPDGGAPATADGAAGWFHRRGRPLPVFTVEQPPAEVMLIRDQASAATLRHFVAALASRPAGSNTPQSRDRLIDRRARQLGIGLEGEDWLRVMNTQPERRPETGKALFRASGDVLEVARGLGMGVAALSVPVDERGERLADAVAASGLEVAAGGRRRAVLLVVDPGTPDASLLTAAHARRYLEAMRIPLEVWTAGDPEALGRTWGTVRDVSKVRRLAEAVAALRERLDRQLVVWLEGRLLPNEVELTAEGRRQVSFPGGALSAPRGS